MRRRYGLLRIDCVRLGDQRQWSVMLYAVSALFWPTLRSAVSSSAIRSASCAEDRKKTNKERRNAKLRVGVDIPTPERDHASIIHAAEGRWRPLLLTAIFTGLRASELRGLRWEDVDLKNAKLNVRQRADRFNKIGPPKTAVGERTRPPAPRSRERAARMEAEMPEEGRQARRWCSPMARATSNGTPTWSCVACSRR